jgi:predicted DsbA family dithiol-disulfide isomerase
VLRSEYAGRFSIDADDVTRRAIEGAGFRFAPPARIPYSLPALAVTELARDRGLHEPVHTRVMSAYWSEGVDIGETEALLNLVAEAGVDRDEAEVALTADGYTDRVHASTRRAQAHGIHAIPAFVIDDRLLVMGAQPYGMFEQAFELLDRERGS